MPVMSGKNAVVVEGLWKSFRLYEEKNQYLKATILKGVTILSSTTVAANA